MRTRLSLSYPLTAIISVLLAGVVFTSIWIPEFAHWYVRPVAITDQVLAASRNMPEPRLLEEIAAMQLRGVVVDQSKIVAAGDLVLRGILDLPSFPPAPVNLPFSPEDLNRGSQTWQLMIASLASTDLLLDAYKITGREDFFQAARDAIVAFAQYESKRWVDHGLMWNDHAISARIPVLVKFWSEYRKRPDFEPRVGRIVLNLVGRSGKLLAKPSSYAWRTSHGTLADLALLQIAAAFPELAESSEIKNVAIERFKHHLTYWINDEGVTLLHSAGYHSGSLYHFGLALRLFSLNGVSIPEEWWTKYAKAIEFYRLLRRPDGTVPMFGDTSSISDGLGPPLTARNATDGTALPLAKPSAWAHTETFALYPVAGHAVWWENTREQLKQSSQTVVTWSYHQGLGHKLADELSMLIWARGKTWITNTGYWPYGIWGREEAESWEASNAPHLLDEEKHSSRKSIVRRVGQDKQIKFIDIERTRPDGYTVRRQIVQFIADETWLVIDYSQDSGARTTITNWTFYPDLTVTPLDTNGRYQVASNDLSNVMLCSFSGSKTGRIELVSGRENPFSGWIVMGRTPTRASTIVVPQPSQDTWSLATFTLVTPEQKTAINNGATMRRWLGIDDWTVTLPTLLGELSLTQKHNRLLIRRKGQPDTESALELVSGEQSAAEAKVIRDAFQSASESFKKFSELYPYRVKVSYLLLAVLTGQELFFFLIWLRFDRAIRTLRIIFAAAWMGGGIWLSRAYFAGGP